jgi:hypothetical protein
MTRTRGNREAHYQIQRLRSARRRWEAREATDPQPQTRGGSMVYRQCPWCGAGGRDGPSAGQGAPTCTRCHGSLIPRDYGTGQRIAGFPTVTVTS